MGEEDLREITHAVCGHGLALNSNRSALKKLFLMQSGKSKYGLSDDTEESLLIFESV